MNVHSPEEERPKKAAHVRFIETVARISSVFFALGALAGLIIVFSDSGLENKKALFGCLSMLVGFGSYAIFYRPEKERG